MISSFIEDILIHEILYKIIVVVSNFKLQVVLAYSSHNIRHNHYIVLLDIISSQQ